MDFFSAMDVTASGLSAERERINVASSNLANVQTTQTAAGGPYKRHDVSLQSTPASEQISGGLAGDPAHVVSGVKVTGISEDTKPPRLEYDPGHPDANSDGYVAYPNINAVEEMVDMITASRAYQAGVTALDTATQLSTAALGIGK
jgi:flagellar basal-body rod protein FlgC